MPHDERVRGGITVIAQADRAPRRRLVPFEAPPRRIVRFQTGVRRVDLDPVPADLAPGGRQECCGSAALAWLSERSAADLGRRNSLQVRCVTGGSKRYSAGASEDDLRHRGEWALSLLDECESRRRLRIARSPPRLRDRAAMVAGGAYGSSTAAQAAATGPVAATGSGNALPERRHLLDVGAPTASRMRSVTSSRVRPSATTRADPGGRPPIHRRRLARTPPRSRSSMLQAACLSNAREGPDRDGVAVLPATTIRTIWAVLNQRSEAQRPSVADVAPSPPCQPVTDRAAVPVSSSSMAGAAGAAGRITGPIADGWVNGSRGCLRTNAWRAR